MVKALKFQMRKQMKIIYGISLIIGMISVSCTNVSRYNARVTKLHSIKEAREDVDKAYHVLQKYHPKLYQYVAKETLDYKFDSLKVSIQKPLSSKELYTKIAPVVAEIRQGHISINYPKPLLTKKERKQRKKLKHEFSDLDFEYLETGIWITNTRGKDSSLIGSQLVEIEGKSIDNILDQYKERIASDGYNTTFYNRGIAHKLGRFIYKNEGIKDSIRVTLRKNDSLFNTTFRRVSKKNNKKDSLRKKSKLTREEKLAQKKNKRKKKKYGYISHRNEYVRNFRFIDPDSTIAYMKIRSFHGDYKTFYKESFQSLKTSEARNLIVDLRNNPGGSIAQIRYLYSFLSENDFVFLKNSELNTRIPVLHTVMSHKQPLFLKIIAGIVSPFIVVHNYIKTYKENDQLFYKLKDSKIFTPKPNRFRGTIYVLINGASFSASTVLATHLQATKRAIIVGEETGGGYNGTVAGLFKRVKLPHTGITMRFGLMQIETPYQNEIDGYGVVPDIKMLPKLKDRLQGIDTELEWILKDIKK